MRAQPASGQPVPQSRSRRSLQEPRAFAPASPEAPVRRGTSETGGEAESISGPTGIRLTSAYASGTKRRVFLTDDTRGRTSAIGHCAPNNVPTQTLAYHFGPDGNLGAYGDTVAGGSAWYTGYAHDEADRLVREIRSGGATGDFDNRYGYDASGNRTYVVRDGATLTYGAAGPNDQFTTGEGYAFGDYEGDGNPHTLIAGSQTYGYSYDEANHLVVTSGAGVSSDLYDGDGRRVQRTDATGTRRFVYDGDQVVVETNGANVTQLYRLPGVGYVRNGAQRYEQESNVGSLLTARDSAGALTGQTEYDAYGREVYAYGGDRGDLRFAESKGYLNDDATVLQLLGARLTNGDRAARRRRAPTWLRAAFVSLCFLRIDASTDRTSVGRKDPTGERKIFSALAFAVS